MFILILETKTIQMKKHVQIHKKGVTSKTANVKHQKNEQKCDSSCKINDFESNFKSKNSCKQPCEDMFDKSPQVLKNYGNEPITKENKSTNCGNLHNQLTNTNVTDSSINLSSPGLCSALQLANDIQLASTEIKKPKQCNMPSQINQKQIPKVSI